MSTTYVREVERKTRAGERVVARETEYGSVHVTAYSDSRYLPNPRVLWHAARAILTHPVRVSSGGSMSPNGSTLSAVYVEREPRD